MSQILSFFIYLHLGDGRAGQRKQTAHSDMQTQNSKRRPAYVFIYKKGEAEITISVIP